MREQGPIVVPLDGSELAETALPYAAALAEALRTHLVLVTAWEGTDSSPRHSAPRRSPSTSRSTRTNTSPPTSTASASDTATSNGTRDDRPRR